MKKFISVMAVTLLLLIVAGCGGDSKNSNNENGLSDELSIFIWGGYLPSEVIEEFEEEFGVKVLVSNYNDNDEMLTKLKSGAVNYDLALPTDWMVGRMMEEDLLAELDLNNIPNLENIADEFQEREFDPGNKFSVPYVYGSLGIVYNTTKIDAPTSWKDLWNPEYKDHVLLQETERAVVSATLQMLDYDYNDPSDEELSEAKEELSKLHSNVLAYTNSPAPELVSEEAWIGEALSDQAAKAINENADLSYVLPEEGGILWMDNWVIPKTTENKKTAEAFIDFILRPEVSQRATEEMGGSNPNKKAVELLDDEIKNNPASYPSEKMLENATWYEYLDPKIAKDMQYMWKEIRVQ